VLLRNQLVVAFGNAKNLIDRLDPRDRYRLLVDDRRENGAERFAKAKDAQERGVYGVWFRPR